MTTTSNIPARLNQEKQNNEPEETRPLTEALLKVTSYPRDMVHLIVDYVLPPESIANLRQCISTASSLYWQFTHHQRQFENSLLSDNEGRTFPSSATKRNKNNWKSSYHLLNSAEKEMLQLFESYASSLPPNQSLTQKQSLTEKVKTVHEKFLALPRPETPEPN